MKTVIVCGGSTYADRERLEMTLDVLRKTLGKFRLLGRGARGAEAMACAWAGRRGVRVRTLKTDWFAHGPVADMIRNQRMFDLHKPDLVVAFPGGGSVVDIVNRARRANVVVMEIHA